MEKGCHAIFKHEVEMFLHRKRKEEIKKKKKNQAIKRLGRLRRVGRRSLSAAAGEKSNSQERMTHFASAVLH